MTRAVVIVPPLLKYASGPLLGPAMLASAGRAAGHDVEVLDLNVRYLSQRLRGAARMRHTIVGDHDKPTEALRDVAEDLRGTLSRLYDMTSDASTRIADPISDACFAGADVLRVGGLLSNDPIHGRWLAHELRAIRPPLVIALSVLFAGQVPWGIAIGRIARELWGAPVIWGGPHVSAIEESLAAEAGIAQDVAAFVTGYAERTFVEALDAVACGRLLPAACRAPGSGPGPRAEDDGSVAPAFDDLSCYDRAHLTLPVQLSRCCAYGRCTFCTYPAVEGRYRPLDLSSLEAVIRTAIAVGARLSLKDSLVVPERLAAIAGVVRGRVQWSACTKLNPMLPFLAPVLADGGCRTLEIGVETLVDDVQHAIEKVQCLDALEATLTACAQNGIHLVLNYITGFPGEDPDESRRGLARIERLALMHAPYASVEHNVFQLERRAPIASRLRVTRSWPFASVLDWELDRRALAIARSA